MTIENLPEAETMEPFRSLRATYTGQTLIRIFEQDYAKCLASKVGFEVLKEVLALDRRLVCVERGKSAVRPID